MDLISTISAMVLILIILCLMLLIVPIHLYLELCKDGPSIVGSYGIACLGITLKRGSIPPNPPEDNVMVKEQEREDNRDDREQVERQRQDQKRLPNPRSLLDAFPAIVHVLKDLIRSIKFENISGRLSFGLDDPVDTAVMSGYLWSALSAVGLYRTNIFIEPYFGGARLEGDFRAELQSRVLWAFVAFLRALGEKKIRKLIREMACGVRA